MNRAWFNKNQAFFIGDEKYRIEMDTICTSEQTIVLY